jgi:hemoglobin-like flavoprotein
VSSDAALIEHTLEMVSARIGDPAPHVYKRLFDAAPGLSVLFVNDPAGKVRGEMFLKALETLQDLVGEQHYGRTMLIAERTNHGNLGVDPGQFDLFFQAMVDTFREAMGADWTAEVDAAWCRVLADARAVGDTM